jgi:hypothetical protein
MMAVAVLAAYPVFGVAIAVESRSASDERIRAALAKDMDATFRNDTILDILAALKQRSGVRIDTSPDAEPILAAKQDTRLTLNLTNVSIRTSLRLILHSINHALTFHVVNTRIEITTYDEVRKFPAILEKVYQVKDLVREGDNPANEAANTEALVDIITILTHPESWDEVGGVGTVMARDGELIIRQEWEVHEEIRSLLAILQDLQKRKGRPHKLGATSYFVGPEYEISSRATIRKALDRRVDVVFEDLSLQDAVKRIGSAIGVQILLVEETLKELGISRDTPVSLKTRNATAGHSLRRLLGSLDPELDLHRDVDVLLITAGSNCFPEISMIYPVGDLVNGTNYSDLIQTIKDNVNLTESWEDAGGAASIVKFVPSNSLIIFQSPTAHQTIQHTIEGLREADRR